MSVVKFPTKNEAPEQIWVCKCGCESFTLYSDGRTQCCHCDKFSTGADEDATWMARKPPVPDEAKEADKVAITVTRIGNSSSALRKVTGEANDKDTAFVIVVNNDGHTYTWKGREFDDGDSVGWLDEMMQAARAIVVPAGLKPNDLDAMRAKITSSKELHSVVVIRQDGDVSIWQSAMVEVETDEQKAWVDRKLAIARKLIINEETP